MCCSRSKPCREQAEGMHEEIAGQGATAGAAEGARCRAPNRSKFGGEGKLLGIDTLS